MLHAYFVPCCLAQHPKLSLNIFICHHNNNGRWPLFLGLCPQNSSSYQPFLGWFGPFTWPIGPPPSLTTFYYGEGSDCRPTLRVSSGIFTQMKVMEWPEYGFVTLLKSFSFFCHIIEPPRLFSYRDLIPFVRWWNFSTKLTSFLLAFAMSGHDPTLT